MKKLVLLLAVAFSVSLFSCGGAKTEATAADTTDTTTNAVDTNGVEVADTNEVKAEVKDTTTAKEVKAEAKDTTTAEKK
ncbi:MAG: hypothetical protein J6B30_04255 [Muribaculaceae bacterium]|nr:hypothetical protein [Muribaculaceae bacterium]